MKREYENTGSYNISTVNDFELLEELADMNVPANIHLIDDYDTNINMTELKDHHRAMQVVSPSDGTQTSTWDGASTIGSATSEPTVETASVTRSRSTRNSSIHNSKSNHHHHHGSSRPRSSSSRSTTKSNTNHTNNNNSINNNTSIINNNNNKAKNTAAGQISPSSIIRRHVNTVNASMSRTFNKRSNGPTNATNKSMTYSKTVRLGGSGNFAAREIDDKTRAVLADMSDFDANNTEIEGIAADIFTPGSGIHDDEVKKIMRVRVSSKQMDLDQQVAASNKVIKRLKDTLSALSIGKNEFITRAVQSEKQARAGWAQALETAQLLDEDRGFFKQKVKQLEVDNTIWKDNAKDTMRELSLSEDKMQNLRNEIEELKDRLQDAESSHTQAMIALEVEKARNAESEKQQKIWQDQQQALQLNAATSQQVKQAQESLKASLHEETAKLRDTINQHSARIKELESELVLAETQFARATADAEAANAKAKSKDEDMKELMKSIREMQNSGQTREENANKLRREAESKVAELEKQLAVVNGEMNVFTHEKSTLRESLENTKRERAEALENLNTLKNQLDELKADLSSSLSQLTLEKELRSRSDQKEREERNERIALSAQMMAMTKEHAQMETQLNEAKEVLEVKWKKEIQIQEEKYKEKQFELDKANEKIAGLEGEISALKISLQNEKSVAVAESASEMSKLTAEINILRERMKTEEQRYLSMGMATEKQVEILEQQIRDAQAERRKMHNLIQELRGNVRVFARVRPFLPNDNVPDDATACVIAKSESALKLHLNGDEKNEYKFEFDRVFGPSVGQEAVFEEVSEFVQSALDGYQVCLFSYGQTGSGKTHSMQGSGNGQMRGIIPRAIEQVGDYKAQLERDGWRYEMQVSFVEIYNETIRDLLRDDNSGLLKHEIKVNPDGRRYVTDINMVPLEPTDSDAVEAVMRLAARHRSVGSTDMNAQSSRSHSVFTLHLTAVNPVTKQSLRGNLNLVDLAGSERLDRSKATGDRAKEAMAINKSLSALTDVFVSIGKKASHVPFRNSKLTYLLQPSLSGDGKTLMMVNLSPTEQSTQESLCSLRFASQVNKCELGKAKRSLEEVADEDEEGADAMTSTSRPGGGSTNARANPARKSSTVSNVNRKSATSNRR